MEIKFSQGINAWKEFTERIHQIILQERVKDVAEIGGGANPLLSPEFAESQKIRYHIIDVSFEELSKADNRYEKIIMDLEEEQKETTKKYDLVFSQMTVEHIQDIGAFYANIYKILKPGGLACFFFACITMFPTMTNYFLPEFLSKKVLLLMQPFRKNEKHGKFKTYYKWCFGPTKKNISRFVNLGFDIVLYTGYFGHGYYQKIDLLNFLEKLKTKILLRSPNPYLCSYAHVLLKRMS